MAGFYGRADALAELRSCTVSALDALERYRSIGIKPASGVLVCAPRQPSMGVRSPAARARMPQDRVWVWCADGAAARWL
jgi:hypothetical protein